MKPLALSLLLLVGCALTPEELNNKAMACMHSLVEDEDGSMRARDAAEIERDCGELFEARNRRNERDLFMQRGYPRCPEGLVALCIGPSCGRPPSRESDLRDWQCVRLSW